jgi:hypothetical protein
MCFSVNRFTCAVPSGLKQLAKKFNSFWRYVILHYASIRDNPSTAPEEILSQPLWLNSEIEIRGKPVFGQKRMYFLLMIY